MRVLVTGGAGFIGSHIVEALARADHQVMVVDNLSSGHNLPRLPVTLREMDITERYFASEFADFQPQAIVHQAAQASLLRSVNEPEYDARVNILGTLNVIKLARRFDARVVMASTSAVYASAAPLPWSEDSALGPDRPYGISKLAGELYLRHSGLSYCILRYGNVYGPRQVAVGENQLIPRALDHLRRNTSFVVNGTGWQKRDFVYVRDVARANVMAVEGACSGVYNIATGQSVSVLTVLGLLSYPDYVWQHGPAKPNEPDETRLDVTRARLELGWQPTFSLEGGLAITAEAYGQG